MKTTLCACGTGNDYAVCCGRYHAGQTAPDAESLMRSRYSAYVLGLEAYLLATWHASTRPAAGTLQLNDGIRWLGLRVLRFDASAPDRAQVEFVATYKQGGYTARKLHECSDFVFEGGRWFYLAGDVS